MTEFSVHQMVASDADLIVRQPSQQLQLGVNGMDEAGAQALIDIGEAWSAFSDGRLIACFGIAEQYKGVQGAIWAVLAPDLGAAHLPLTRFFKSRIAQCKLVRLEAMVRANVPAECTWALLGGLKPGYILRKFGAASEDHVLFERIL